MSYTLGQAARAAGRSKTTLNRAIKSGKLSAVRSADGSYTIDPAELQRVYPLTEVTGTGNGHMVRSVTANGADPELALLQQLLAERERLVEEQASAIRDLRQRLDAATEERQREAEERRKLTAILTDQRAAVPGTDSVLRPSPWWRRRFGRGR